jgi:hypothetical protein
MGQHLVAVIVSAMLFIFQVCYACFLYWDLNHPELWDGDFLLHDPRFYVPAIVFLLSSSCLAFWWELHLLETAAKKPASQPIGEPEGK